MKKISPKTGLFIVVPVILGMLITGIVMWPSEQEMNAHKARQKAIQDSLKKAKEPVEFRDLK